MKNYTKLLFQRVVVVSFCIAIQAVFLILGIGVLSGYYRWFSIVMEVLSWIAVIVIVSNRTDPGYKIAWIIPILAFPVFGILFYLLFGGNRLSRRLKKKMHAVEQIHRDNLSQDVGVLRREAALSVDAALQSNYLAGIACCPVCENTETTYYGSGEAAFGDMLEAISRAERYIFLEYFIIHTGRMWDEILKLLRKKAAAGVDVRVIYDDFGCITTLPGGYYKKLEAVGIRACAFNPYVPVLSSRLNNRDHRKFLIVDGEVGFTGGVNLADEYINEVRRFGYWKDTGARIEGEAVWSLTSMFLSMWNYIVHSTEDYSRFMPAQHQKAPFENDGFVQPYGDSPLDHENVGENIYLNIINRAKNYVYIFTPYLIIDHEMLTALCNAAKDGVDVRIVTPGIPDKKMIFLLTQSYYAPLIQSGVKIYQYTPGFIHAKCFVCDDEIATVGSVNLDFRSLYLHFECGVFFYRSAVVAQVKEDCLNTFACSEQMTAEFCRNRPVPVRLLQSVLRLLAPLL